MAHEVSARISARTTLDFDKMVEPIEDRHPGSGRNLKWTLMALADFADRDGFAWPSVRSIEEWSGLSTRSVQRALKQAQVLNLIRVKKRTDTSSQYIINLEALPYVERKRNPKQRGPQHAYADWAAEPDLFDDGTGATDDTTRCHGGTPLVPQTTLPGATVAPKPIIEPSEEPVSEPSGSIEPVDAKPPTLKAFIASEWKKLRSEFPEIGDCRRITDQMAELIRQRTKEHRVDNETDFDVWVVIFRNIRASKFLTGRAPPSPGRTTRFHLTLSWLLKPHLFREVINGKYASSAADESAFDPVTGEVLGPAAAATRGTIERLRNARQPRAAGGDLGPAGRAEGRAAIGVGRVE